jgi:hypothetical protein
MALRMELMKLELTELEKDIIKELVNIGLARAADSFAIISKELYSATITRILELLYSLFPYYHSQLSYL